MKEVKLPYYSLLPSPDVTRRVVQLFVPQQFFKASVTVTEGVTLTNFLSSLSAMDKTNVLNDGYGSYILTQADLNDDGAKDGMLSFYFAPPLTELEIATPYNTYFEVEPSMYWPKVLTSIQASKRLFEQTYVARPRYKEAYQGPTRVKVEEFYSPRVFEIPTYEPMIDRGLNDEIGVQVNSGFQSFWYSVGNLNLDQCLHYAINISVVLDPPVVVTLGNGIQIVYDRAYLSDTATNFTDWPDEVVIDDRQREVSGGFVRRKVTALSPAITLIDTPTTANIAYTTATLGGRIVKRSSNTVNYCGVVYSLTANNSNPEKGNPLTFFDERVTTTNERLPTVTSITFTRAVTGLAPGREYSFKPYAIMSGNIDVYGPVTTFTTLPLVTLPTNTPPTSSGTTLGGTLADQSQITVDERGFVYSLTSANADPLVGGTGVTSTGASGGGAAGTFSLAVSGLTYLSAYSFKPWARSGSTYYYGPLSTFTTIAPTVTFTPATTTGITTGGATLNGSATATPSTYISSRGFVYSLNINNSDPVVNGSFATDVTVSGTGNPFNLALTDLEPDSVYKFKIWVRTPQNTYLYSAVQTFTTAA
jgi:hypothetical protein